MPRYMLLLHDNPASFTRLSPGEMQAVIEKYVAWGARLREAGLVSESHKLTEEPGKVMRGAPGRVRVTDGPYSETKEVLGGYYIIEAENYAHAIERAGDCPQIEYGGTIEVREVDEMGGPA